MGLMSSLYTGVSGLQVNQRGLNAVAHNLSNVETTGYVRQQLIMTDSSYTTIGTNNISSLQIGYGATASAVLQVRDQFLDKEYRQEVGRQYFYQVQYETSTEMEEILGETEGVAFQDSIKELWESMQELCKEPDSIVTRASFIQTSVSFIERAETMYQQIKEYQLNLNTEINKYVNRINELGDEIHELNDKIMQYEASGVERANDYRDARNVLLDELAQLTSISYKEQSNGVVTVMLEDQMFVSDDIVYHMDVRQLDNGTEMLEPYWPCFGDIPVYTFDSVPNTLQNTDVGALKGLLLARGSKVGHYTDIPAEPTEEEYTVNGVLDKAAYEKAMKQYEKDVEQYNLETESSPIVTIQAEFDQLIHGIVTTINDLLSPNKEIEIIENGQKKTITVFDAENAPVGMDENNTPGEALFNRKSMDRYTEKKVTVSDENGKEKEITVWQYNEEDADNNYSLFTLGEIEVNEKILKDPSVLPLSHNGNTGDYSIDVCQDLLSAWQEPFATLNPSEYKAHNFNEYYTEMIGALATRGERYNNVSQYQETMVNGIENQRVSMMGVSSDEELTNMIKYQQAYNASARYISVVDQMLEHLLNALG